MGRDGQLGEERDGVKSGQEVAKEMTEAERPAERPESEAKAEADLLRSSDGDPFTQESD